MSKGRGRESRVESLNNDIFKFQERTIQKDGWKHATVFFLNFEIKVKSASFYVYGSITTYLLNLESLHVYITFLSC